MIHLPRPAGVSSVPVAQEPLQGSRPLTPSGYPSAGRVTSAASSPPDLPSGLGLQGGPAAQSALRFSPEPRFGSPAGPELLLARPPVFTVPVAQDHLQGRCLSIANLSPRARIQKAWKAGCWAREKLQGRVGAVGPSPVLSLPSRLYAVVDGGDTSVLQVFQVLQGSPGSP